MDIQPLKIKHIPLHCPLCEKRFMNILGQPLPNHAQIRCRTYEGNEMDLGICNSCVEQGVTLETCQAVLEGIKDFWTYEINANKSLNTDEKEARIAFNNNHTIENVVMIENTGEQAQEEARKRGELE